MVVAMVAVRMMKVPIDQVINVITVRNGFVSAARAVHMTGLVTTGAVRAVIRVVRAHLYLVLVHMISMRMMQMPIVQVVDMITMLDSGMPAPRTVLVIMLGVMRFMTVRAHGCPPLVESERVVLRRVPGHEKRIWRSGEARCELPAVATVWTAAAGLAVRIRS